MGKTLPELKETAQLFLTPAGQPVTQPLTQSDLPGNEDVMLCEALNKPEADRNTSAKMIVRCCA